jgi:hypothetical protein
MTCIHPVRIERQYRIDDIELVDTGKLNPLFLSESAVESCQRDRGL